MCVAQLIRRYETPVTHYYIHSSTTHVETSSAGVFLLQCPTLLHRAAELQYLQWQQSSDWKGWGAEQQLICIWRARQMSPKRGKLLCTVFICCWKSCCFVLSTSCREDAVFCAAKSNLRCMDFQRMRVWRSSGYNSFLQWYHSSLTPTFCCVPDILLTTAFQIFPRSMRDLQNVYSLKMGKYPHYLGLLALRHVKDHSL